MAAEESKPKKRKKRKREEGEPTGARSSYLMFCAELRDKVNEEHPDKKLTEQAKIISERCGTCLYSHCPAPSDVVHSSSV